LVNYTASPNTAYFSSLLNTYEEYYGDTYQPWANSSIFTTDFKGLGLPALQYYKFADLLSVLTEGQSSCVWRTGGICTLQNSCDYYTDKGLWDFSFRIQFVDQSPSNEYIRIPLVTLTSTKSYSTYDVCLVNVQMVNPYYPDSRSIIFGSAVLQSLYAEFSQTSTTTDVTIYKSMNAINSVYVGSAQYSKGANPFNVKPVTLLPQSHSSYGLPTFTMNLLGIPDNVTSQFYVDFNSQDTVAWDVNCNHTAMGVYPEGSCSSAPTLMNTQFNGTNLYSWWGNFTNQTFGGYVVDGTRYYSEICIGPSNNCVWHQVYSVWNVSQNYWLWNQNGAYGIIGMSPYSSLWEGFINPDSLQGHFTIQLARNVDQNVNNALTLGGQIASEYQSAQNLTLTALSNFTYALNNLTFGVVYYDS
jgi:hypothetical protein